MKYFRRIELWGEGFNWFDFKRWNQPIERMVWERNNTKSGNWPTTYAATMGTGVANGWRWRIPIAEIQYNQALLDMQSIISYGYDW